MCVIAADVVNVYLILAAAERWNQYAPAYWAAQEPCLHVDVVTARKFCASLNNLLSFGESFRRDQRGAEFVYAVILSNIEAVLQSPPSSAIRLLISIFLPQHPMRGEDVAG